MPDITSVLQLEKISFENIQYSRNVDVVAEKIEYKVNFTKKIASHKDGSRFRISLTANMWSEVEGLLNLSITIVGFFNCDSEDLVLKQKLVENNAIAILFPYLRSQISLVTTQPDIPPITLPPMNIINMFQENGESEKE